MKKIMIVGVVSLALTACAGQSKVANTAMGTGVGAATGAAVGAGIGALAGNAGKGAWIGAAAGAALGTGIGYYLANQEEELRNSLQGTDVQVQRQGEDLAVIMPGNVSFATNSATLSSNAYGSLDSVAAVLVKSPDTTVTVSGHTDSVGSANANLQLSKSRAESVARYLVSKGVNSQRIQAVGFGSQNPIASNDNEQGRSQNRRVEIKIHSTQQPQ